MRTAPTAFSARSVRASGRGRLSITAAGIATAEDQSLSDTKMTEETKYVFVTGGVSSSLGKGIIAASLAKLLQAQGYRTTIQKLDPYINVDPGTLNPYEHGECFVTDDGAETDLDLGHYERFTSLTLSKKNNFTTANINAEAIKGLKR